MSFTMGVRLQAIMYLYVCLYVYVCMFTFVCMYMYVGMHVYLCRYMSVYMCVCMCVCMSVWMYPSVIINTVHYSGGVNRGIGYRWCQIWWTSCCLVLWGAYAITIQPWSFRTKGPPSVRFFKEIIYTWKLSTLGLTALFLLVESGLISSGTKQVRGTVSALIRRNHIYLV